MTAIYGLWRFDEGEVARDFRRMELALSRYGEDRREAWSENPALMMGRCLHYSLSEDAFNESVRQERRYLFAGDVRLTEREDLARQLGLDEQSAGMSDSAIAAVAVETWHEEAFDRIYGAFAIAAWDRQEQRLLLARDHLGQKPLFFHRSEHFFAFASMPCGLHGLPEVPRSADMDSMKRFLAVEYQADGRTHYEGIERIMPANYAIVTPRGMSKSRYWNPDLTPLQLASSQDYVEALERHLDNAVEAALRGVETQVGAHLSSGFDSTAVATTAARLLAPRGGRVVAYTAAPREGCEKTLPGRTADESRLAAATAAMHPNMKHVVIRSDRSPLANLDRTASIYGVPVLNICNETWVQAINDDAAARGIGVMLEAPMGNSTISETGMMALPELLRSGRVISWFKLALAVNRRGGVGWLAIAWNSVGSLIPNWLYRWLMERRYGPLVSPSRFSALKEEYYREATIAAASDYPIPVGQGRLLSSGWIRPSGRSLDHRLIAISGDEIGALSKGLLGEWKIDYRDPTADRRLVEFSLRVPVEQLIHDGEPRALLRKVLAGRAPREVLDNRSRGYQAADWYEWLDKARPQVIREIARMESFEPSAEILDLERLKAMVENWPENDSETWTGYEATADYRCCLLRAISAASFMRQASGSNH